MASEEIQDILAGLGQVRHLEREKARLRLGNLLGIDVNENKLATSTAPPETLQALREGVIPLFSHEAWEARVGAFQAAKLLVSVEAEEPFVMAAIQAMVDNLEHIEVRVRQSVVDLSLIVALSWTGAVDLFAPLSHAVISSIHANFDRNNEEVPENAGVPGKHDTEGWKCLETSVGVLRGFMKGAGARFRPYFTSEVQELVFRCLLHLNRFVRETGYFTCEAICSVCDLNSDENAELTTRLGQNLARGLADNWSQVRFSASVATRAFMAAVADNRDAHLAALVPPMCLNRYYVAEGVRLYSQESWRLTFGTDGPAMLARFVSEVVKFYVAQTESDNHAVREAACQCVAELASKVEREAVAPHVHTLLAALKVAFQDESWPVRDCACAACGQFVRAFPEESADSLSRLFELWFDHLDDNISSVRETAAIAIGNAVRAYPDTANTLVLPHLNKQILKAKEQAEDSQRYSGLENTTTFGVAAKRARDNDPDVHSNKAMYSCGSLAPKLRKGGCMDCDFLRPKQPWEASDGAVLAVREMSAIVPECVPHFIPAIIELSKIRTFAHYHFLQETIWKSMPVIAKNVGKKAFKRFMDDLLDPLFATLSCGNRLAESAAGEAIGEFSRFVGPSIFEGHLTPQMVDAMHRSEFVRL